MYLLLWKEIYMIQGLTYQKIFTWESKLYITQRGFRIIFASATVTYISNRLLYLNLELLKYPFRSITIWILIHCYMTIYNVDLKITSVIFLLNENEATSFEPLYWEWVIIILSLTWLNAVVYSCMCDCFVINCSLTLINVIFF